MSRQRFTGRKRRPEEVIGTTSTLSAKQYIGGNKVDEEINQLINRTRIQNTVFGYAEGTPLLYFPTSPPPEDSYNLSATNAGYMYWTPPANPPNVQEDADITDFPVAVSPATTLLPVTITSDTDSTRPAILVSFEVRAINNNTDITTQLLINGLPIPEAPAITENVFRQTDQRIAHQWSPNTISIGDVVTVEISANQSGLSVEGSFNATVLLLIHPGAAAAGGAGLPAGGVAGQLIVKQSGTDGDAQWESLVLNGGGA